MQSVSPKRHRLFLGYLRILFKATVDHKPSQNPPVEVHAPLGVGSLFLTQKMEDFLNSCWVNICIYIYCQLGDYMLPTTCQGNPETPLIFVFTHKRNYSISKKEIFLFFSPGFFGGELLVLGDFGFAGKMVGPGALNFSG